MQLRPRRNFSLQASASGIAYAMLRRLFGPFLAGLSALLLVAAAPQCNDSTRAQAGVGSSSLERLGLREIRSSPLDLEVGGNLSGVPPEKVGYLTRDELLQLPQVSYRVTNDSNFTAPVEVRGVLLEELAGHVGADPETNLIVAVCGDQYRANYPRSYLTAHHPLLVLTINGRSPDGWLKDAEGLGLDMGPYLISQSDFTSSFRVLSYSEAAQNPWGVVRLEFRKEKSVFGPILPRGAHAGDATVQAGYRIAQQNCFRCHNMGEEGGKKAGRPWLVLAAWASAKPDYFADYVRNPQAKNTHAQMPGNPKYDDATLQALISYFRTFVEQEKP
jgi:mono/diheme cytochrome c family protein